MLTFKKSSLLLLWLFTSLLLNFVSAHAQLPPALVLVDSSKGEFPALSLRTDTPSISNYQNAVTKYFSEVITN